MKSYCLLVILGLVAYSYGAENEAARFLVLPQTIVSTVTSTVTANVPKLITTSCATTTTSLSLCRRRRSSMEDTTEDDDEFGPTEPIDIEITESEHDKRDTRAVVSVTEPITNKTEIPSSDNSTPAPIEVQSSIESTPGMAEVHISNLNTICKSRGANPFFGAALAQLVSITVLFSSTTTVSTTVTNFVTSVAATNKFTIVGCLPSPLPFNLC